MHQNRSSKNISPKTIKLSGIYNVWKNSNDDKHKFDLMFLIKNMIFWKLYNQ